MLFYLYLQVCPTAGLTSLLIGDQRYSTCQEELDLYLNGTWRLVD